MCFSAAGSGLALGFKVNGDGYGERDGMGGSWRGPSEGSGEKQDRV